MSESRPVVPAPTTPGSPSDPPAPGSPSTPPAPFAGGPTADCAACPQYQRFRTLIDASEVLCSALDVQSVLDRILAFVTHALEAERSTIYVLEPHSGDLVSLIAQGLEEGVRIRLKVGEGLAGHVAATGEVLTVSNAYEDTRFATRFDFDTGFRTSSMMAIPLTRSGEVMGVLQVLNRKSGFFDQADRQYLLGLGNLIAVAIENARLHESEMMRQRLELEKEQMDRELRMARSIQERLFPRSTPCVPGVDIAGVNVPSEHVSGDYYDFFCEGVAEGGDATRLGVVVADVSGHGIPAALLMSVIHAGLRTPASVGAERSGPVGAGRAGSAGAGTGGAGAGAAGAVGIACTSPGERLTFLNQLLFSSTDESHFATMFLGVYDVPAGRLRFSSGGHTLPVLLRADGGVERLEQAGIPLGMVPGYPYGENEVALGPGDILVVFTDGVTEAFRGEEEFGDDRLIATIRAARDLPAAGIAAAIMAAVREWSGRETMEDDVTAVVLRVL